MASRLICKAQLLKQSPIRQVARSYATESKQATQHFPEECTFIAFSNTK